MNLTGGLKELLDFLRSNRKDILGPGKTALQLRAPVGFAEN